MLRIVRDAGRSPAIRIFTLCLLAAGCAADTPPALLTLIEPERMVLQDSELLPDSAKAAIRSYLSRVKDSVWVDVASPELERLVGADRGMTALLNREVLPKTGRSVDVMIDVPDVGFTEFRLARVRTDTDATPTFIGQALRGEMSILLLEDSVIAGRITTLSGVFNFRSGLYGLINVAPVDTSGTLPSLYLMPPSLSDTAAISSRTAVVDPALRPR